MILKQGEKIHVIHRRHIDSDPHRHFLGLVEAYENGLVRATGHVYTVDPVKFQFFRRPERRTRLIAVASGDVLVNILPADVNLDEVVYKQESKSVRVTDGGDWYLDLSELAWR